jgi:Fic family protein
VPKPQESQIKIPETPPSFGSLYQEIQETGRIASIFGAVRSASTMDRYLHWDEIKYRPAPKDLTPREHWFGLKIHRHGQLKAIPLEDLQGSAFQFSVPEFLQKHLHELDLKAGGNVGMFSESITSETKDRYVVSSLIEEAITSSQLEGATTTRPVAKEMIRSNRPPRGKAERMILNNYLTMQKVRELKNKPLSKELVFELHCMITEGTLEDSSAAGRFRSKEENVRVVDDYGAVYHDPPSAETLDKRMEAMCRFANGDDEGDRFIHPVVRAMVLHFWLAYDHPFVDGNGRTARALFYWSMLRSGYWLFEFISISHVIVKGPIQYARAFLYTETDENDLTYFLAYHGKIICRAVDALMDYIREKQDEQRRVQLLLRKSASFNYRQQAILSHALRHPGFQYSVQSHATSHQISLITARKDLVGLADKNLLTFRQVGKAVCYEAVPNLEESLKSSS